MNKLLFLIAISFGVGSVLSASPVAESPKPKESHTDITSVTPSQSPNANDSAVTTESLKILVQPGVIVNSTYPKVVTVGNSSLPADVPAPVNTKVPTTATASNTTNQASVKNSVSAPSTKTVANVSAASTKPAPKSDIEVLMGPVTADAGRWIIRNKTSNTTCIIAQMAMQLNVTYPTLNNQVGNATIDLPVNDTDVNGTCSGSMQSMIMRWGPGHSLQINFAVNDSAKDFYVSGFALNVNASIFKNHLNDTQMLMYESNSPQFLTPLDMSYKCDKAQQVNLTSPNTKLPAVLTLKHTQLEAYMNSSKTEFGAAVDCDVFETPDIVPIAVGVALAILVLVVLAAYLIGRKRSQNRGYLSM